MASRISTNWSIAYSSATDAYTLTYAATYDPEVISAAHLAPTADSSDPLVIQVNDLSWTSLRWDKCTSPVAANRADLIVAISTLDLGQDISVSSLEVDTINEKTAAAGVTVDSVLLKDNGITATNGTFTNAISAPKNVTMLSVAATAIGSNIFDRAASTADTQFHIATTSASYTLHTTGDDTAFSLHDGGTANADWGWDCDRAGNYDIVVECWAYTGTASTQIELSLRIGGAATALDMPVDLICSSFGSMCYIIRFYGAVALNDRITVWGDANSGAAVWVLRRMTFRATEIL